ncbi:MAG: HD domain-containing protein [Elusimicrobia bacterium]|nr:HD domain-containing protein [Elusimicrobiota bacterium]
MITRFYRETVLQDLEGVFVFSILLLLGFILYVCDHRLTFLNLYFIPILLAGYFLSARSAVLGGVLTMLVVGFIVVEKSESFSQELSGQALYLYLVVWSSALILAGALVGRLTEQLRERFAGARRSLERLGELQEELRASNLRLEEKNLALEGMKTKVEAVLHYTMDPVVARLVINRQLRNEKREVSVLFADLENFTEHMETVPPEASVRDLNRLFGSMEPILALYKGHLDKYVGDGLMVEFGVPYFSDQRAVLASLAGLKMQSRMAQADFPWKMRIGIATGPVLVGLMGSENRKNYTAIGDAVNLASRLQTKCPVGSLCVDERTHQRIERWFRTRRIRHGLAPGEAQRLEDNLAALDELLRLTPRAELCVRAAEICALLGEPERGVAYERRALELAPAQADDIHRSMGRVLVSGSEHAHVPIKGKRNGVAAFEVLGLRDPLADHARVPREAGRLFEELAFQVRLPAESLLPLEAAEGSLGHGEVTAALSAALADAMGLSEGEKRDALLAGYVHDIGKRSVPDTLLANQARMEELAAVDREALRSHAGEAERVLRELALPVGDAVLAGVREHHERFDGAGYPRGLKGHGISLLARILQIPDEYEALTAWRPYHEPWEPAAALSEIEKDLREGKFDPKIGDVFLRMMKSGLP